ncbi:MAG: hypothetical protein QOI13_1021 [Paraburkholderia sp.]|jgi:hypothetical protein|nr:hypothetical protein [Paraburkholderia sp.]
MTRRYRFQLQSRFDPDLLERVEGVFHGENLVQMILHAHLLIERALTLEIASKLARPEILEDPKYGRWSFHRKLALYIGLCEPAEDRERMLFGFNKLRNMIAHGFRDESVCVETCLPWEGEQLSKPDAIEHVWVVASILLFELGAIKAIQRLDVEIPPSNQAIQRTAPHSNA